MSTPDPRTRGIETTIAVAQTCPVPGDVSANLTEHLELARGASAEGADLALFPELSLTGYELERAPALAFTEDDPRLDPLRRVSAAGPITLVVGAPARLGDRLHIAAFILSPDGTMAVYTKQRLGAFPPSIAGGGVPPPPEATVFHAGDRDPLVRVGPTTAAVAVCADIGDPEHPRRAAARGADTYLAAMFVIPSDYAVDSARLRGYAVEHSLTVALANYGSATGGLAAAGRSAIWSSTGELLVQLGPAGSGLGVVQPSSGGWLARVVMPGARGEPKRRRERAVEPG